MMRGALSSLFVVAVLAGTAAAEESPVQVVDRPAAKETPSAKPQPKLPQEQLNEVRKELAAQAPAPLPVSEPPKSDTGLRFGSYGRVIAGTDLRGGKPEKILVVAHGPRIVEDSYLELDFSYGLLAQNDTVKVRPVITLAFDGTLFHDTGEFDAHPALRNVYLEMQGAAVPGLTLWAGSRMYRGDDIYLFDFWPLDDLNTVGGGAQYRKPLTVDDTGRARNALELAVHAGANRLDNPFQFQQI